MPTPGVGATWTMSPGLPATTGDVGLDTTPGCGVTVGRKGASADAEAAPNAASPRNMARTVPRIVFNTRIVPQLETFWVAASSKAVLAGRASGPSQHRFRLKCKLLK